MFTIVYSIYKYHLNIFQPHILRIACIHHALLTFVVSYYAAALQGLEASVEELTKALDEAPKAQKASLEGQIRSNFQRNFLQNLI